MSWTLHLRSWRERSWGSGERERKGHSHRHFHTVMCFKAVPSAGVRNTRSLYITGNPEASRSPCTFHIAERRDVAMAQMWFKRVWPFYISAFANVAMTNGSLILKNGLHKYEFGLSGSAQLLFLFSLGPKLWNLDSIYKVSDFIKSHYKIFQNDASFFFFFDDKINDKMLWSDS